ncbi:GFA family protein [Onishia niordana]|uniref:GFA family protein n=1 Tax=Onishia niordana TaxID=2508711 RepID=UPI00109FB771|nr:GFA family protein [Halomonas niordiana]
MKGSCLCGAIEVSTADRSKIDVCHCRMCRQWGGGPMLAVHCGQDVTFSGTQKASTYQSSDWAERGFCPTCGTHLFYHLLPADEYILPAGLFEELTHFEMNSQIFIDQKPSYYEFGNATPTMTGEQVFAQFSESGD